MDNTQATPTELAYLAGFVDGEGCIAIQRSKVNGRYSFGVNFKVTNSDSNVIAYIQSIYLKLGVNPYIREKDNIDNPNWKSWYDLYLTKQTQIKIVLEAILPYLVLKKARAIIMLRYIDKQIDKENAFWDMKALNSKGESSETTREAPSQMDEDIVQAIQ